MVGGEKAGMGNREWGMEDRQGGECTGGGGGTAMHGFAQPHRPQRTFIPYSLFPIPAPPASHIVLGNVQLARLVLLPALAQRAARAVVGGDHFEHALEAAFHSRVPQVDTPRA